MNLIFYFENKIILSNKISKEKKKKEISQGYGLT